MRKFQAGVLLAGCVAALAFVAPASAQAPLKVWKHGIVQAKSDAGIVLMATHKGFDKAQGLNVEMVQFTGDALALKALLAGELDSYEGSPGAPLIAASRGADLKVVGCYWPGVTYAIFSKQSMNSPEELKGKTLAISSPGALPDLVARAVLEKYNIPQSEVHFAAMGSDTDRMRAVAAGVVDAAAVSTEFMHYAATQNVKLLVHAHEVVPQYLRFCTTTTGRTIASKGDDLAHYLAAQMQGIAYALSHRDETIALTHEVTKTPAEDTRAGDVMDEVQKYKAVDAAMPIPLDKLAWMQDLLIRTGNMKTKNDFSKLVDGAPREAALKLVPAAK
jgi:NitT/TauT family transport system substrate-binding protein